jgi:hypothetical protein
MMATFNYDEAFSRNIGWVTEVEQHEATKFENRNRWLGGGGWSPFAYLGALGYWAIYDC